MKDDRLKIGVVGTGGIFEGWKVPGTGYLTSFPWIVEEAKVVALCDANLSTLNRGEAAFRKVYNERIEFFEEKNYKEICELFRKDAEDLKIYQNIDEVLDKEEIDLIVVLTPAHTHLDIIRKSLKKGCHVMCEKPLARTWIEAEEIVKLVESTGKFLQYNENFVFADPYYDIRNLIQIGEVGEVEAMWLPSSIGGMGNSSYLQGGIGALLDMAVHTITLGWFLIGFDFVPKRIRSISPGGVSIRIKNPLINGIYREIGVEDYSNFVIEFENIQSGQWINLYIEGSWSYQNMQDFKVVGSKGEIQIKEGQTEISDVFGNVHFVKPFHAVFNNTIAPPGYAGFSQEILAMVKYIKEGIKPLCDERIGSETLLITHAAYLSEANGRKAISLDECREYLKSFGNDSDALQKELLEKGIKRGKGQL